MTGGVTGQVDHRVSCHVSFVHPRFALRCRSVMARPYVVATNKQGMR